jgi:hypothetical protein
MPADDLTDATTEPLPPSGTGGDLAAEVEPLVADGPPVASAPGGWRRVVLGLLVGLAAGALLALVLPRRRPVPSAASDASDALDAPPAPSAPEPRPGEDHGTDQ